MALPLSPMSENSLSAVASPETIALTTAMAAGDDSAVERFYACYFNALYREARNVTRRDEAFCLDVVQEATLRIIRNIRPVDSESQLIAWLKLVIRTTAFDLLRSEKRRKARESAVPHKVDREEDHDEQIEWLRRQIRLLDPQLVEIIELRYEHRWTLVRIANRLRLSVGTIDGRLRKAFKQLREKAREQFDE